MLLKMLKDTDYVIQECNQIIAHIGTIDVVAPLTDETIQTYGEYRVTNIYPRSDNVYGVMFEIELPHLTMAD